MALTTKRIIALPSQTNPQEGDYLAIDNATSGTHKIPVGRIGVELDDTLTEAGKAADAKAVGDALDEIRSQIEVTGTASGAIATFTDGSDAPMKSLGVTMNPIQDLHGYDHPWVGGGGVNKLPTETARTLTQNGITVTADGNGGFVFSGTASGGSFNQTFALDANYTIQNGDYLHMLNDNADDSAVIVLQKAGDVAITTPSFAPVNRIFDLSQYVGETIESIRFYIEDGTTFNAKATPMICRTSTATTFEPYENICPISGWDSVNVQVASGNLIDVSTNQSGVIDANGNEAENSVFNRTDFIPIDKAKIYIKTSTASGYTMRVHGYSSSKAWVQQLKVITTNGTTLLVGETVPNNVAYVRISYPVIGVDNTELWQADAATTVNLGRTVYGGTLDVVSGVLTVTGVYLKLNTSELGGTDSWPTWVGCGVRELVGGGLNNIIRGALSSIAGTVYANTANTNDTLFLSGSEVGKTKAELNAMAIDVDFFIPLAEPQTYQLTPTEVKTLLGENNVWADSGDVEVVYVRDLNITINNLLNNNGTRSLGMMAMSAPTDEQTEEPSEDDMR